MPPNCVIREIPRKNYVIGIPNTNSYYFRVVKPITVRTVCGSDFNNQVINVSGMMSINSGCIVGNDEFTLNPHIVHTTIDEKTIFPTIDLDAIRLDDGKSILKRNNQENALIEPMGNDFEKLSKDIVLAKERQKFTFQVDEVQRKIEWAHDIYIAVQVAVLLIVCTVVFVTIKHPKLLLRLFNRMRRQSKPVADTIELDYATVTNRPPAQTPAQDQDRNTGWLGIRLETGN